MNVREEIIILHTPRVFNNYSVRIDAHAYSASSQPYSLRICICWIASLVLYMRQLSKHNLVLLYLSNVYSESMIKADLLGVMDDSIV